MLEDEGPEVPDEVVVDCELDRRLCRVSVKLDDKVLEEKELKEALEDVVEVSVVEELPDDVVLSAIILSAPELLPIWTATPTVIGDRRLFHRVLGACVSAGGIYDGPVHTRTNYHPYYQNPKNPPHERV